MVSSASVTAAIVAFNRGPQRLTRFEDPFTHKPLDKPPIPANAASDNANTSTGDHTVNILA
jgi:hypothetical protein